jgi:hypothetical protein
MMSSAWKWQKNLKKFFNWSIEKNKSNFYT